MKEKFYDVFGLKNNTGKFERRTNQKIEDMFGDTNTVKIPESRISAGQAMTGTKTNDLRSHAMDFEGNKSQDRLR